MSTNPHRGEVDITLGGEKRIIRLNNNALAEAESILGMSMLAPIRLGVRELRALLFAGLKDRKPAETLARIGELMDAEEDSNLLAAVVEAWNRHLTRHEKPEEAEDPQKAASPVPGQSS